MKQKSKIVITGASSGIGRGLALEMARRGYHLGLTARRLPLLEQLREEIFATQAHLPNEKKVRVELTILDVCQCEQVGTTLKKMFDRMDGVDCVVVNAGANDLTDVGGDHLTKELNLIQTNLSGAIATVHATAAHFMQRQCTDPIKGQIVGISSLASLQPIVAQAAYCASKAGFSMYLEATRIELRKKGIRITNILPGYINTDIVDGADIGKMPFAISVEQAAREMADLIEKGVESGVVPSFPWKFVRPFLGHLPERFAHY